MTWRGARAAIAENGKKHEIPYGFGMMIRLWGIVIALSLELINQSASRLGNLGE